METYQKPPGETHDRKTEPPHRDAPAEPRKGSNGESAQGHAAHSHDEIPTDLPRLSKGKVILLALVTVIVFGAAFVARFIPDEIHQHQLRSQADEAAAAPPVVNVALPQPQAVQQDIVLPADARPMAQTAMYARIDGFLGRWYVDIGDHVDKGQLLAIIDAPDTDAELAQAQAALQQAQANVKTAEVNLQLANATYERYHGLLATGSVTQQDLDTRQTNAAQAASNKAAVDAAVKSAQATVERLKAQQSFEKITAPFSGTITFRNYDVGARISASNSVAGQELFDIADTDKLRIYVNVPQAYVTLIQLNQPVSFVSQRNYGTRPFYGYVARSAGALDPATRTLLTELDFDNKEHLLFAGMYGEVHISTHKDHPTLTVPTAAMMFEAGGTQLAIVDGDNKVHFKKVTLGEDLGTRLEVVGGLTASDRVVTNPGEKLAEGVEVQIAGNDQPKAQTVADAPQTAGPTTRMAAVDPTAADAPAMATSGGSGR